MRHPRRSALAQNSSTPITVPGSQPNIHLVAPVANGQWTMPAGDYGNTRFSPLDKINTGNVQNLHVVATAVHRHTAWIRRPAAGCQ